MNALTNIKNKLKKSVVWGSMLGGAFGALVGMVNLSEEVDENSVKAAVENTIKKNKDDDKLVKDLNNFVEVVEISDKILEQKAKRQFDVSNTFEIELNEKDKDGYNRIPNKVSNIKAQVSEQEALNSKNRKKDGKQKTRVDED